MEKNFNSIKNEIRSVIFGKRCTIIEPSNLYECKLGDDVFVGPFVEIQKNVAVGDRSRISSHSFLCSKVIIGKDCFIGHGVVFTNDKFKNFKINMEEKNLIPTNVGDNVLIGSNSTILPVKICSGTIIGAGSVVTKDINIKGIYAGNPAKLLE